MFVQVIKTNWSRYLVLLTLFFVLTGCTSSVQKTNAEKFIIELTDCKTYETATTDSKFLEKHFKEYFTEEGYKKFLKDKIQYIYPQLFYTEETKSSQILRIQNTKTAKEGEKQILKYEIKYALEGEEATQLLEDQLQLTMNKEGEIEDFMVLNTSDVMHKLVIDMRIY